MPDHASPPGTSDLIEGAVVEPITRAVLGALDVDGGITDTQLNVLQTLVDHLWVRPDLDLRSLDPLHPGSAAAAITSPEHRRRFIWMVSALEMCRRPISAAQVARIGDYAAAMSVDDTVLDVTRAWLDEGAARAQQDILRFFRSWHGTLAEQRLRARKAHAREQDEELLDLFDTFEALPEGTLGREFLEFHERYGFELPGAPPEGNVQRAVFVAHDMNHVIADYPPTPAGEISLAAMSFAAGRCEPTWAGLLLNLSYHEGHVTLHDGPVPPSTTLSDPAALQLFGEALDRGRACTENFTSADHLALVDQPLDEVRARFGIRPCSDPSR